MVISLIESNFVRSTLLQQLRLDGRSLDHLREVNFEFSTVDRGHVIVHLGKTR